MNIYKQLLRIVAEELNVGQVITPKFIYTLKTDRLVRR